ncbi:MAG: hypothetical protein ACR2I0_02565, partial [Rhodoferax sp.]
CSFGRWFGGSGLVRYGKFKEYALIGKQHELCHTLGVRALQLARDGQHEAVQACLQSLDQSSQALLELLTLLQRRSNSAQAYLEP